VAGSVQVGNGHFIGRDFIQTVNHITQAGEDPEEAKSVIALYLHALAIDLAGLKLGEIDSAVDQSKQTPLQLADVYVPLDTTLQLVKGVGLAQFMTGDPAFRRDQMSSEREMRPVSALEALAAHRELTLLGKPGSGKSTFGSSTLLALAQVWQGHRDELAQLGETWTHGPLLPVRVILRRFAEWLPSGDKPARAGDVWNFVARDLENSGYGLSSETMKYVQRIARNEGAMILLDGLDECGDSSSRQRVLAAVRELMRSAGPKCRFLLTARPYAWPTGPDPDQGVYALADLNDTQIEQFIHAWYAALVKRGWRSPGESERKKADLLTARQRPDLLHLARNPLLLTLMATLHTNKGRLPDDRADLYNDSVELLMLRWNRQIGADQALLDVLDITGLRLSDLRGMLEELAFKVHEQNVGREGVADIGEDRLVRAFRPLLNNSKDKADVVVDYIEKRAGLLVGQGEKDGERQFTFPHRTFQEFLAACHLAAQGEFPAECARLARAAPAHWQVSLPLAARLAKAERGASAADELVGGVSIAEFCSRRQPTATDWNCALLAGTMLQEIGLGAINTRERTQAIASRVAHWLSASLSVHPREGGMDVRLRAQAGDVLAALGDPRFDPQRFYLPNDGLLGFVAIPADPDFMIGTRTGDFDRVMETVAASQDDRDFFKAEINDQPTPTREFYIARYPVTVAQFRTFVEATGFNIGDEDALSDPDSRPVRWVSWHEALAYCDWLNDALMKSSPTPNAVEINQYSRAATPCRQPEVPPVYSRHGDADLPAFDLLPLIQSGKWRITLPSELEWEKAARGGLVGTIFPWGDDPDPNRANYGESNIGGTSPVGCFPPNAYGLYDMTGNVWEWTRSLWGSDGQKPDFGYPYDPNDQKREDLKVGNDIYRVVRGGSWDRNQDYSRCAVRDRGRPDNRYGFSRGFRVVVLRSAPVV